MLYIDISEWILKPSVYTQNKKEIKQKFNYQNLEILKVVKRYDFLDDIKVSHCSPNPYLNTQNYTQNHEGIMTCKHSPHRWPFHWSIPLTKCSTAESVDVYFVVSLNKLLNKQLNCRLFETPIRRPRDVTNNSERYLPFHDPLLHCKGICQYENIWMYFTIIQYFSTGLGGFGGPLPGVAEDRLGENEAVCLQREEQPGWQQTGHADCEGREQLVWNLGK